DIDLMFVYGTDGETAGGGTGRLANGEYFARVCRELVALLEAITDEGYAFRVDLRLRPEGRMGGIVLSLDGYREYYRERAELREANTLKAIFRLTERGYLAPDLGRLLSRAYVHLRTVEHRLQILHELQTHTLPNEPLELGRLARRVGIQAPPARAAKELRARH